MSLDTSIKYPTVWGFSPSCFNKWSHYVQLIALDTSLNYPTVWDLKPTIADHLLSQLPTEIPKMCTIIYYLFIIPSSVFFLFVPGFLCV